MNLHFKGFRNIHPDSWHRYVWACSWSSAWRGAKRSSSGVKTFSPPSASIDRFLCNHRHANHHDHSDNIDLADLVLDTEHMLDDLDIYTERELESMNVDEKVALYIFLKLKNAFLGFHLVQCPWLGYGWPIRWTRNGKLATTIFSHQHQP